VNEKLRGFIVEEIMRRPGYALPDDADLLTTGLIDSLGIISLVQFIEDETDLDVPAEDVTLEHFLSIATIVDYLRGLGAKP
jgi:acyl carrier protein